MAISKGLKISVFLAGVASLMAAVGCGGGGVVIPHPTGNYSNASFKGSYVYEIHGFLGDANNSPYREAGVITADGSGNITAGTDAAHDREIVATYQQVGVTWWVEKILPERWGNWTDWPLEAMRTRIRQGPPG